MPGFTVGDGSLMLLEPFQGFGDRDYLGWWSPGIASRDGNCHRVTNLDNFLHSLIQFASGSFFLMAASGYVPVLETRGRSIPSHYTLVV